MVDGICFHKRGLDNIISFHVYKFEQSNKRAEESNFHIKKCRKSSNISDLILLQLKTHDNEL